MARFLNASGTTYVLEELIRVWKAGAAQSDRSALKNWWKEIDGWRARNSLAYKRSSDFIMPQHAVERLYELTKDQDTYITTEVGQNQRVAFEADSLL